MKNFDHQSGDYLQIDEAKIYYEVQGKQGSPALVVLHGGFGNLEDFHTILPNLDRDFRLIGIDSRGHGKSTLGSAALTYERIQLDVERVLEHLNINSFSILGFSDGGTVAYRLAALTSLHVEKIVTVGTTWHTNNIEPLRERFASITPESWKTRFPDTYDTYQKLNPEPDFNAFVQAVIQMWLDSNSTGHPDEAVDNITCPVLIVRGDDDHLLARRHVLELSERVKNSMLFNLPFAGHAAHEDQAEIFTTVLNRFLGA